MSDLYTNYTTFIASSRTLDIIESCIDTQSGFLDFDKIKPTPSVLNHLSSSTEIIDNEQFQRVFGYLPTTMTEMSSHLRSAPVATYDDVENCVIKVDTHVTRRMVDILLDTYSADHWEWWQEKNWGCTQLGTATRILHRSEHILNIKFFTRDGAPLGIYDTLEESLGDLHIIAGATYDRDTELIVKRGCKDAFSIYWADTIVPRVTAIRDSTTNTVTGSSIYNKHHIKPQHYILAHLEDEGFYVDGNLTAHEFL